MNHHYEKSEIIELNPRVPSRLAHLAKRPAVKNAIRDLVIDCLFEEAAKEQVKCGNKYK